MSLLDARILYVQTPQPYLPILAQSLNLVVF